MEGTARENTKRILKNTIYLYGRMLFSMLISLYTSRLILQALGVTDYGIYNVVGGLVAMFSLVSGSLSAAISRFLTYELGYGDKKRLQRAFSTSFIIQLSLALIVWALGETIGVWFLNTQMTIPADRMFAANMVFQASLLTFGLGLISMPYSCCVNAHERMNIYAYVSIIDSLVKLGIVVFIAYAAIRMDRLIVYAFLIVALSVGKQIFYFCYCRKNFEECHVSFHFDKMFLKSMGGFAGWNFIGASSALLRTQGANILLNIFFGPTVNAARGVAGSVMGAVGGFSGNFLAALNPQLTKSYASGERDYMMSLIFRACKFSFFMLLVIAMPILLNTQYILQLWLTTVPKFAAAFVTLTLTISLIEVISSPLITVQLATGNIRNYQLVVGGLQCLNFPLDYVVLKMGFAPYSIYYVAIVLGVSCLIARLAFLKKMIGLPVGRFCGDVLLKILYVTVLAFLVPAAVTYFLPTTIWGLAVSVAVSLAWSGLVVLGLGCSKGERQFILSKIPIVKRRYVAA